MNKNTVIGSILMALIVFGWMYMNTPNEEAQAKAKAKKAAAAIVQDTAQAAKSAGNLVLPSNDAPEAKSAPVLSAVAPAEPAAVDSVVADSAAADSAVDTAAVAPKAPERRTVTVETDRFVMTLDGKGGKIKSLIVKALKDTAGNYPELFLDTAEGALDLTIDGANLSEAVFATEAPEWITVDSDTSVQFTFTDVHGSQVIRSYGFMKDGPAVRQENKFVGFTPSKYELAWNGGMKETESIPKSKGFMGIGSGGTYYYSEVIFNADNSVEREMSRDSLKRFNEEKSKIAWAGLRRKYVAMTVQFDEAVPVVIDATRMEVKDNEGDPGTYKISLKDDLRGSNTLAYNVMVLPLKWDELAALNQQYEKVIVTGWQWCGADVWFVWICKMLLKLLNFLYGLIPNYAVAIILLTIIVRAVTTPFTLKQMKATRGMAALKPQMDEINVKYRSDPQKKQAAMMELYAKNGINPLQSCTGCLPMLLQFPIFMGLFFVLGRAIELRGQHAFLWVSDLSRSDVVWSGISIPIIMPSGLAILPWIMVATMYFQTKVTMGTNAAMDPAQQKMMIWMMPAMMLLFSAVMPSGLVIYMIVSNIWGIVQYKVINRNFAPAGATSDKLKGKDVKDAEIVKKK